jgi:hypothetical protein
MTFIDGIKFIQIICPTKLRLVSVMTFGSPIGKQRDSALQKKKGHVFLKAANDAKED